MGSLIFIVTGIATFIVLSFLRKRDKDITSNIVSAVIVAIVLTRLGTYQGCADGWVSHNIGKQGACSHHGGVKTFINIYGTVALTTGFLVIIITLLIFRKRQNEDL